MVAFMRSLNHWSWTARELLVWRTSTPCLASVGVSSAVAPVTAKLAPWVKSAPLSRYGLSSGSPRSLAKSSIMRYPSEHRPVARLMVMPEGSFRIMPMAPSRTKFLVSDRESPKL